MSWRSALSVLAILVVAAFGASVFAQGTATTSYPYSGTTTQEMTPPPDTTPPYVVDFGSRLTPDNRLQAGVAFSEGIDPTTVSPSSVYIVDALGLKVSTDAAAADNGASAMLPGPGLDAMQYRLVVRHSVKDLYGNAMSADYYSPPFKSPAGVVATTANTAVTAVATTTTAVAASVDTTPPSVMTVGSGVADNRLQAYVRFSEPIDQGTISDNAVYIVDASGQKVSTVTKAGLDSAYASLADTGWAGVSYRIFVRHGVKDLAGNQLATDYYSAPFQSTAGKTTTAATAATTATTTTAATTTVEPNESAVRVMATTTASTAPPPPVKTLEEIGQSVHMIQTQQDQVAEKVNTFIESSVDRKLANVTTFSPEERQRELERIKRDALARGGLAADIIKEAVAQQGNGLSDPNAAGPVLKSSLSDIELLIKAESGVSVDLSLGSRAVTHDITEAATVIKDEQDKLASREGLDLYRDSDNDGVSDYDERNIYHTDPNNAHTGKSALTDGERILLGLDAHSTSPKQVPVESPLTSGQETQYLFEVKDISFREKPQEAPSSATSTPAAAPAAASAASTSASAATSTPAAPESTKELAVSGRALPNTFVTLYIFSTPIVVTVKTDENGQWSYTLDKTLQDGEHTLYVAMVDNGGRIIAKSKPIAFTQTAEAASFVPLVVPETAAQGPLDSIKGYLLAAGAFAALLFFAIALVTVGVWRTGRMQPPGGPAAPAPLA